MKCLGMASLSLVSLVMLLQQFYFSSLSYVCMLAMCACLRLCLCHITQYVCITDMLAVDNINVRQWQPATTYDNFKVIVGKCAREKMWKGSST